MLIIREYQESDRNFIEKIHDNARKIELRLAGLSSAFLPFKIAAEREGLFQYPGLFVALQDDEIVGFVACASDELAWLYVEPTQMRKGIGRSLSQYALSAFPDIHHIEVLKGNEPARALYESLGFKIVATESGAMPGNEEFAVEVYILQR